MTRFGVKTSCLLAAVALSVALASGCGSSDHARWTVADRCLPGESGCGSISDRWWRRYRSAVRRGQGTSSTGGSCPGGNFARGCTGNRVERLQSSPYGGFRGPRMSDSIPQSIQLGSGNRVYY